MSPRIVIATLLATLMFLAAHEGSAQSNFYAGKTIRIIVGFSPGGGYDALARMLSRHMPKYIPGHPSIHPRREHDRCGKLARCKSHF